MKLALREKHYDTPSMVRTSHGTESGVQKNVMNLRFCTLLSHGYYPPCACAKYQIQIQGKKMLRPAEGKPSVSSVARYAPGTPSGKHRTCRNSL
jgi:hypothetical protein